MGRHAIAQRHLYALAEAAVLNQQGWRTQAIHGVAEWALYEEARGLTKNEVVARTRATLGVSQGLAHSVSATVDALVALGSVVVHGKKWHLAEARRAALTAADTAQRDIERETENAFETIRANGRDLSSTPDWHTFADETLLPLIEALGARTYSLLSGEMSASSRHELLSIDELAGTSTSDEELRARREVGLRFLETNNPSVRKYIMARLNAHYLAASGGLPQETIEAVGGGEMVPKSMKLVVDSNALFSMLDLHQNPANAAVISLLELREEVKESTPVEMFSFRATIEEAKDALRSARDAIPNAVSRDMADGALRSGTISGLVERYLQRAVVHPQTPATYFDQYINYLEAMLEDLNIGILDDAPLAVIHGEPNTKRRVQEWESFQHGDTKPKSHRSIRHDVGCLEFVKKSRPSGVEFAASAEWWFLSVDLRLKKHEMRERTGRSSLSCVVLPDEAIEMLRVWLPRQDRWASATLNALRIPFSFFEYDNQAQETSLRILDSLSLSTEATGMSADLTQRVLADKLLRAAFANSSSADMKEGQDGSQLSSAVAQSLQRGRAAQDAHIEAMQARIEELEASAQAPTRRPTLAPRAASNSYGIRNDDKPGEAPQPRKRIPASERRKAADSAALAKMQREIEKLRSKVEAERSRADEATKAGMDNLRGGILLMALLVSALVAIVALSIAMPGAVSVLTVAALALIVVTLSALALPFAARRVGIRDSWPVARLASRYGKALISIVFVAALSLLLEFGLWARLFG